MSRLLLGVDGGATKTVALVADAEGTVLGAGRAGSSDIHSEAPPTRALDNVVAAAGDALRAAGIAAADVAEAAFGLCGADWPEDFRYFHDGLAARLPLPAEPVITNDAYNSLRAGSDDGRGVALVLGTGGAIAARGPRGEWFSGERLERSGATELGRVAYDALVRAEYADGPRPAFEPAALGRFGVDSVESLVYAITRTGGTGWRGVARLAPALLEAAHDGDQASRDILRRHARRLADYVRAAARRVGLEPGVGTIVLAGGLLRSPGSDLREAIAASLPDDVVVVARLEPVHGAILTAADRQGVRPSVERLLSSGPPDDFFSTAEPV